SPGSRRSVARRARRGARATRSEGRSYPRVVSVSRSASAPPGGPSGVEHGAGGFLERAEVRDVLAWMRLLVDPRDAAAVVRALAPELIERLGMRGRALLTPEDAAGQRASLEQLRELACAFVRRRPASTARELARHLAGLVAHSRQENRAVERLQAAATGSEVA